MSDNEIGLDQQPLLSSQPSDHLCSDLFQQQQHVKENEVTIDMKEMIRDCGDGVLLPQCCIYRVPLTLRHLNEGAYTPKVVSIGPFHYGNQRLQDMERHKQIMFKRFTHEAERAGSSLDDLVRLVKDLEPKVRASYSETINLTAHQLVKLTLTDAGFIIQLFMRSFDYHDDAKLSQPWLRWTISQDLLLLENQLPFFVIKDLFNKAFLQDDDGGSGSFLQDDDGGSGSSLQDDDGGSGSLFLELAYGYFNYFNHQKLKPNPNVEIKNFTDLLRSFYLPIKKPIEPKCLDASHEAGIKLKSTMGKCLDEAGIKLKSTMGKCLFESRLSWHSCSDGGSHVHNFADGLQDAAIKLKHTSDGGRYLYNNAEALQEAGIKLKRMRSKCLLDLNLSGHILEIPQLLVEDRTELLFRNMIALEQCRYPNSSYITDYIIVWDRLVDTHRDVDLLVQKKIISNSLGDAEKVALLFNGLLINVYDTNVKSNYSGIFQKLNDYCEDPWNRGMATLRRDYCNTPWRTVGSIAGIILLTLTIGQTIISILQIVLKK